MAYRYLARSQNLIPGLLNAVQGRSTRSEVSGQGPQQAAQVIPPRPSGPAQIRPTHHSLQAPQQQVPSQPVTGQAQAVPQMNGPSSVPPRDSAAPIPATVSLAATCV